MKAIARFQKISPRKARAVVNLIRHRSTWDAIQVLGLTKKSAAPLVRKIIDSAVANARYGYPNINVDRLFIASAMVDKAPNSMMRRWRPRAMGRATRIQKGMSHITIVLGIR